MGGEWEPAPALTLFTDRHNSILALRLASSMPKWKPAMKDGKAVKCLHLIRVDFPEIFKEDNVSTERY